MIKCTWRSGSALKSVCCFCWGLRLVPNAHIRQFTTTYDSISRGADNLFWSLWAPASIWNTYIHEGTNIYTLKINEYKKAKYLNMYFRKELYKWQQETIKMCLLFVSMHNPNACHGNSSIKWKSCKLNYYQGEDHLTDFIAWLWPLNKAISCTCIV